MIWMMQKCTKFNVPLWVHVVLHYASGSQCVNSEIVIGQQKTVTDAECENGRIRRNCNFVTILSYVNSNTVLVQYRNFIASGVNDLPIYMSAY